MQMMLTPDFLNGSDRDNSSKVNIYILLFYRGIKISLSDNPLSHCASAHMEPKTEAAHILTQPAPPKKIRFICKKCV
jgi:hypothetical protein